MLVVRKAIARGQFPSRTAEPIRLAAALAILIGGGACSDRSKAEDDGLVIGLSSDDFAELVSTAHVLVKKDGVAIYEEAFNANKSSFPKEIPLVGVSGARIDVRVEALPLTGGEPVVVRLASAVPAKEGKKLLRVHLDNRCVYL